MTNQQKVKQLFAILTEAEAYTRCMGKVSFDMQCCAPEEGMEQAGDDMAVLGRQLYKLTHSKKYERLVRELHEDSEGLSFLEKKAVERLWDEYRKTKNFTPAFSYEFDLAKNQSYGTWIAAKKAADFSLFRDNLETVVGFVRKSIDLRDEKPDTYYNACLDDNEKGGSQAQLDAFFAALKERIVPLMRRIAAEGKPIREDFLNRPCPVHKQEEFSRYLLELQGLRKSALVLMSTEHPFTQTFGSKDVRVTTHYYENNFISNIFSTLHEGGHAMFMQNEPAEFETYHVANGMSNAMHECTSRFYENLIGRSEEFVNFIHPKLLEITGDTFADVSARELYEAVNIARPGLIRIRSDELCYSLHIMIRYEIEKAFINGDIAIDDIPALWNAKYKEYLGVEVPDDAQGCLQDVHWTEMFGYFPSYALGNAYSAQIFHRMKQDFDASAAIAAGNLKPIADWMRDNVFSCASISTPDEWIRKVTGEPLNVNYYLDYLEEKYSRLYGLK